MDFLSSRKKKLCYFGVLKIVNFPSYTGVGHMVYMQFSSFRD